MKKILFLALFLNSIFLGVAYSDDITETRGLAVQEASLGNTRFSFVNFQSLLEVYPTSMYTQDALFATGEYYFLIGDQRNAAESFMHLVNDFPGYKGEIFALVYLLKLAQLRGQTNLANELQNKIVAYKRPVSLFRHTKKYIFTSPMYRKYKVIYHPNSVEFSVDGHPFMKIPRQD